jgi:hypothetical protein
MAFEDVLGQVMQWVTATEAMAALAAELELQLSDSPAPAEVAAALTRVSGAAGLTGLDELPPPQRMMLVGVIRMYLRRRSTSWTTPAARRAGPTPTRRSSTAGAGPR